MPPTQRLAASPKQPSMKGPPKRKGNGCLGDWHFRHVQALNESPSEKEGKCSGERVSTVLSRSPLNESPSEKEGKFVRGASSGIPYCSLNESPSEKEGKYIKRGQDPKKLAPLNESPSEKEGKCEREDGGTHRSGNPQ